jgi:hypothetical protein
MSEQPANPITGRLTLLFATAVYIAAKAGLL